MKVNTRTIFRNCHDVVCKAADE